MKLFLLSIILLSLLGLVFLLKDGPETVSHIQENVSELFLEELGQRLSLPPPLRGPREQKDTVLTQEGVLAWTNVQRKSEGIVSLQLNSKLNSAAARKLQDMFEKQYFAHVSPSGLGAGDLAKQDGYEFLSVGENLALGNYEDDKALVQAWMDSPGHRANIMNGKYREIGIAVGKGTLEGQKVWLAVQIFGTSLSLCSKPQESLKIQIEGFQAQLLELEETLQDVRAEVEEYRFSNDSRYKEKVLEYNNLVDQYNFLVQQNKATIDTYNTQVQRFNECAKLYQ